MLPKNKKKSSSSFLIIKKNFKIKLVGLFPLVRVHALFRSLLGQLSVIGDHFGIGIGIGDMSKRYLGC